MPIFFVVALLLLSCPVACTAFFVLGQQESVGKTYVGSNRGTRSRTMSPTTGFVAAGATVRGERVLGRVAKPRYESGTQHGTKDCRPYLFIDVP